MIEHNDAEQVTVYVVDDDEAVRASLDMLLSSVSLNVETYASGQDFLANWKPERPGVLLVDLRMPGMSGLELQQKLVAAGHRIPIIFISAHGDVSSAVRAMRTGADEFLTKPFGEEVLLDRIQKAIRAELSQRESERKHSKVRAHYDTLTPRQREVLECVVAGKSNKEIARELDISVKTVELHRGQMMSRMAAQSIADLVKMHMELRQAEQPPTRPRAVAAEQQPTL